MIISTSWSRLVCVSRNFSATMTTSSALPASTPFNVWYSPSTATNAMRASPIRTVVFGSGQFVKSPASRHAIHMHSRTGAHRGSVGQCGRLAPATTPAVQSKRPVASWRLAAVLITDR